MIVKPKTTTFTLQKADQYGDCDASSSSLSLDERSLHSTFSNDNLKPFKKASSSSSSSKLIKKSVHFARDDEVFEITHHTDMSDDEIEATWYAGDDYADMKEQYQITVYFLELDGDNLPDGHEKRGLEGRTRDGQWERYTARKAAVNDVLDEQDRQWEADIDEDELLRAAYQPFSVKALDAARQFALQDEKDARSIHKSAMPPTIPLRRTSRLIRAESARKVQFV